MKIITLFIMSVYVLMNFYSCGFKKKVKMPKDPYAKVRYERLTQISLSNQGKNKPAMIVGFHLDLYNPFNYGSNKDIKKLRLNFYLKNKRVYKIKINNPNLRRKGVMRHKFNIPIRFSHIKRIFPNLNNRQVIAYQIKGVAVLQLGGKKYRLPIRLKGHLPALNFSFSASNFKVGKPKIAFLSDPNSNLLPGISFKKIKKIAKKRLVMDIECDLHITNNTKLQFNVRNFETIVKLANKKVITGNTKVPNKLDKNRATFHIKNRVNFNKTLMALLKKNRNKYSFEGKFNLYLPKPFNPVPVTYFAKGKF